MAAVVCTRTRSAGEGLAPLASYAASAWAADLCPGHASAAGRVCGWGRDHSDAVRRAAARGGGRVGVFCGAPCTRERAAADARVVRAAALVAVPLLGGLVGAAVAGDVWGIGGYFVVLGAAARMAIGIPVCRAHADMHSPYATVCISECAAAGQERAEAEGVAARGDVHFPL